MSAAPDLTRRHRTATMLLELSRPDSAAVLATLPPRPGSQVPPDIARRRSGLPARTFWTAVGRLLDLGVVSRSPMGLGLQRQRLRRTAEELVSDSPLPDLLTRHPRLRPFVDLGRVVRPPTEPALVEELYQLLGGLFRAGEELDEPTVGLRIGAVHDDPAEVRRALVDRGLLHRDPGGAVYRCPGPGTEVRPAPGRSAARPARVPAPASPAARPSPPAVPAR